ncbi:uncharacterized protein BX664DRAFT_339118 [Halteromyces radiatus]|uniref:uncharacterized protein n=1 Tax=Halteromyces radiatus TaxID=101107 RepID=UPI0022205097|nr:uncharacterized protein BX664DRAFT_339118 [Halteromyces radiatus]KAI8082815.1 hypothetical protein BX664DRAFT_339118 [Halteromyces radiatus]
MLHSSTHNDLPDTIEGILLRMNQELTCPICLTLLTQCTSTPCGHNFCRQCILQSLTSLPKCPICKVPITKRGLYSSDSVEAIVQEFLVLRLHYEKDTGNVLSQIPNKEYHERPVNDLSQLYPYPTKATDSSTNLERKHQMNDDHQPLQSTENILEPQLIPTTPSITDAPINHTTSNHQEIFSVNENTMTRDQPPPSSQQQQYEPSTLSLLLFPSHSPPQTPAPSHTSLSTRQSLSQAMPSPSLPPSSYHLTSHQPSSSQRSPSSYTISSHAMPLSSNSQQSSQESPQQLSSSCPTGSQTPNTFIDTSPTYFLIHAAGQLNDFTVAYLTELEKQGKLQICGKTHVSSKVTHFVFPSTEQHGIQSVSSAYLQALVLRKRIVREEWIKQCYQAKEMVDATPFYTAYFGDGQHGYEEGPKRARISALHEMPLLFDGKVVYFHESVNIKLKKQFMNLMVAGGGQVIQKEEDMTDDTLILCQSFAKKKDDQLTLLLYQQYRKQAIGIAWMTQSILRYELLNEQDFVIGSSIY